MFATIVHIHLIDARNTLTPVYEKWDLRDHLVIIGCGNQKNISYLEVYEDLIYVYVLTEHLVTIIGVCLSGAMSIFSQAKFNGQDDVKNIVT